MNNPAISKIQRYFTRLHFLSILLSLIFILVFVRQSNSQINQEPKIYGVTVDAVGNLSSIVTSLTNHQKKMTTRIVFDEWIPASEYINAVNKIHNVSYIMGEILDSYYMNQYDTAQYRQRVNDYINTLGTKVDLWEIGNEVNGEWLGSIPDVINKIYIAYNLVKQRKNNRLTSITLYYNKNCWENPQNEMFRWINEQLPMKMKYGLDYVWVSYYEDDCNNYQPNWQQVFDSLHVLFPNAKLGIGECGTKNSNKKAEYIRRYYSMNITTPNYVGGYFWWYYKQDCVPWTKPLWATLDSAIGDAQPLNAKNEQIELSNYPNPFNPSTVISYSVVIPSGQLVVSSYTRLTIYDAIGREIVTLVNEQLKSGAYKVEWDGSNYSSGVYYYKLIAGDYTETKKMILIK